MHKGACLCGNVSFTIHGEMSGASACHCGQCRKQSGHVWASALTALDEMEITGEVTWYASSDIARRGFCARCGSFLFWATDAHKKTISVALGALEQPTGLTLERHIFVADKGDYYDIADSLPQWERS